MQKNLKLILFGTLLSLAFTSCLDDPLLIDDETGKSDTKEKPKTADMGTADTKVPSDMASDVIPDPKDEIAPQISDFKPAKDETKVELDAEISAVFSEAMNTDTLNATNIKLAHKNGEVESMLVYDEEDFKVAIQPTSLALLTEYTLTFEPQITDLAGNPLEKTEWTFQTRDGK